jgi:capsular polysaccharide biosynthesis protein
MRSILSVVSRRVRKTRIVETSEVVLEDADVSLVKNSSLFDLGFYNLQISAPFDNIADAIRHYIDEGASLCLNPNEFFDTAWYYEAYPHTRSLGLNPLLDFISQNSGYERNPSSKFDCAWYLSNYLDVANAKIHPLLHYMKHGRFEFRSTSRLVVDPAIPTRFANIMSDLKPLDPIVRFELSAGVEEVSEDNRTYVSLRSAGQFLCNDTAFHDRRDIFPPRPYFTLMKEVGVVGGSRLLVKNPDVILSDEIAAFRGASGWSVRPHKISMGTDGQARLSLTRAYPNVIERGIHLMHDYGANYFHMITELLPRILIAEEAGLESDIPFLIQDGLHPNLLKLIELMNPEKRRLIVLKDFHLYKAKEMVYLSDVSGLQDVYNGKRDPENTALHGEAIATIVDRIKHQMAPSMTSPWRKLYIRRVGRYRGLLNENKIEEILVDRGFELVSLEGLSLAAQIRLFSQASCVIAPTGAALTNMVWCQPDTKIGVLVGEHEAMPMEIWSQLGQIPRCDVSILPCKRVPGATNTFSIHDDYKADIDLFEIWLHQFL